MNWRPAKRVYGVSAALWHWTDQESRDSIELKFRLREVAGVELVEDPEWSKMLSAGD